MTKAILCRKKQGCCPTVEIEDSDCKCQSCLDNRTVTITDDDGDVVTMTYKQFQILKKTEL